MKNILITLIILFSINTQAQWINDDGEILTEKMLKELKTHPPGSEGQNTLVNKMVDSLMNVRLTHPALQGSLEKKFKLFETIQDLRMKSGEFQFLNPTPPQPRYIASEDTISSDILHLEEKIKRLNDSLNTLYEECIPILESGYAQTRATKERAAKLLGGSRNVDHIHYVFQNDKKLTFGNSMDVGSGDCWGCNRSGMQGLFYSSEDFKFERWRFLPFFIKYWGDPDWIGQKNDLNFEFAMFSNISNDIKKPWLLYDFILANAEDPDSPILKDIVSTHNNFEIERKEDQEQKK